MLAHSPPFPITIDHFDKCQDTTTEDTKGIIFALRHRDRVRHVRLVKPISILKKLLISLGGEFPSLEYLLIEQQRYQTSMANPGTKLKLPETFRAPHLRHLLLTNFTIPIGSPTLTTMGKLATLSLYLIPRSAFFHPKALLQRLSLIPLLEVLNITFTSYDHSGGVEGQLLGAPITTCTTLPNLRLLGFQGATTFLEEFLPWVTTPHLEKLNICFLGQLNYSIPRLEQFLSTAENLRLNSTTLKVIFHMDYVNLKVYPHKQARVYTLSIKLGRNGPTDFLAIFASLFFRKLSAVFSTVEHLTLENDRHMTSFEAVCSEADRIVWRQFLGALGNVKTLRACHILLGQLSLALRPGQGELAEELLPKLQELSLPESGAPHKTFTRFIKARRNEGVPVTVFHF